MEVHRRTLSITPAAKNRDAERTELRDNLSVSVIRIPKRWRHLANTCPISRWGVLLARAAFVSRTSARCCCSLCWRFIVYVSPCSDIASGCCSFYWEKSSAYFFPYILAYLFVFFFASFFIPLIIGRIEKGIFLFDACVFRSDATGASDVVNRW